MFDFHGNTSSNRTGAWSRHAFVQLFTITQQSHAFSKPPCTSPINASKVTNVNNVIRFVRQCKSSLYLILQTAFHINPVIHVKLQKATAPVTSTLTWTHIHTTIGKPHVVWPLLGPTKVFTFVPVVWTCPTLEHSTGP